MTAGDRPPAGEGSSVDFAGDVRRTSLAAERTWLAWWRTGLAVTAVALAVGRLLPGLTGGARWPSRLLGLGYGVLALGVFLIGAMRQRASSAALRSGSSEADALPGWVVAAFTAASMLLAAATLAIVAAAL
jgi:putative membrane protein